MLPFLCSILLPPFLLICSLVLCQHGQAEKITVSDKCGKDPNTNTTKYARADPVRVKRLPRRDIIWCVSIHNKLRSEIANGQHMDKYCPDGSDILEVVWDRELETKALEWAVKCYQGYEPEADRRIERFDYGQNMYTIYSDYGTPGSRLNYRYRFPSHRVILRDAAFSWFSQIGAMNRRRFYNHSVEVKHFTQLVWHSTKYIGCAVQEYFSKSGNRIKNVVCNYGPRGNIKGQPVYHRGQACSDCPEGYHCSYEHRGLCTDKEPQQRKPKIIDDNSDDLNDF